MTVIVLVGLMTAAGLASCGASPNDDTATRSVVQEPTTTQGEAHAARVKLYPSLKSMADDSTAVVVGTVTAQRVAADIDPATDFTISTISVTSAKRSNGSVKSGTTVEVRQFGSANQVPLVPLMEVGGTYLVYLTASGLPGELGTQFYVTGSNAGLYQAAVSGPLRQGDISKTVFTQVAAEEGEALPAETTVDQAAG
ncbi:hypothetical protein ASH00_04545 [Arthrobacter sp. Soil782]|nr:hypothetical protein ASH00_04545 [Arthrobacter sp. Soil782]